METINKANVTNSIMNLSNTLYVIADAKALRFFLYSSGNIQTKSCLGSSRLPPPPPPPSVTLSWRKPQYPEG